MEDPRAQLKPVTIFNARLLFRNFKGAEQRYSPEGRRTFSVVIPDDIAEAMESDGWNIKWLKPSEEEQEQGVERGPAFLPVEARYDAGRPPKIVQITSRGQTHLDERLVAGLDDVDIAIDEQTGTPKCDLIINPRFWQNSAGTDSGVKAYLKSMYVTIEEDELDKKYSHLDAQ